jgi:NADH-quinone oxidoreductase subunit A
MPSLVSAPVSEFLRAYLLVAVFGAAAVLVVLGVLSLGSLIRPKNPTRQKLLTYESGVDPTGSGFLQSNIRYYVFALLFVMFDVEAVFIFPWALGLEDYDVFGLVEMVVFIVILALGLVYAWRKGVLKWL